MNGDGAVYSATVTTYNARNQITLVRQHAGAEGSGTYQDTVITYDGHGRLKTKHAPEQDAGTATTWNYNDDDTLHKVTDARGASATYGYNNHRHLVNTITYSAPLGVTDTPNVSFAYDTAGNRTSMTDGSGSLSYQYNSLSQLMFETRTFNGLSGSFALGYSYSVSGQLESLTDPFGARVEYAHDQSGRLSGVTGTGFAEVTQYASGAQYRAWGGLKSLAYGNTKTLAVGYNEKLQPTSYEVPGVMKKSYQYNADSRLRFTQDQLGVNSKFDRSYEYDHLGRVTKALSGAEARGQGATEDRPYNETLAYDAMNHLTLRETYYWDRYDTSGSETYVNNRRAGWGYDADGRLTSGSSGSYFYDASGRAISFGDEDPYMTDQQFDSDGRRTKSVQRRIDGETSQWVTEKVTYYMSSSVLGGALITELDVQGAKERTLVYAGGNVLASQTVSSGVQAVHWEHRDASGGSFRGTEATGQSTDAAEMDPMGANAGLIKPLEVDPPDKVGLLEPYPEIADMLRNPGGGCVVDRMPIPCEILNRLMEAGGVRSEYPNEPLAREPAPGGGWRPVRQQSDIKYHGLGLFEIWMPPEFRNEHSRGGYVTYVIPQDTRWASVDPDGIRDVFEKMLKTGECGKFVEDLINWVSANTEQKFVSDYVLDLFDAVLSQGGFVRGGLADKLHVSATLSGNIDKGKKPANATIFLSSNFEFGSSSYKARAAAVNSSDAFNVLHELIHLAGLKDHYTDRQIAVTLFEMTGTPGLPVRKKGESEWDFIGRNSTYFSEVLDSKCRRPPIYLDQL